MTAQNYLLKNGFEILEFIDVGPVGLVMLATDLLSREKRAIKYVQESKKEDLERIEKDAKVMQNIQSEYLLRLYDIILDQENSSIFLIMEYCPLGNLLEIAKTNMNELDIPQIFSRILQGIIVLSNQNIVHSNIKVENILFIKKNQPKIGDLCFSQQISQKNSFHFELQLGNRNLQYCAPEQLKFDAIVKPDLFSCGTLIYEICGFNDIAIMMNFKSGDFPSLKDHPQKRILEIAKMIMNEEPNKRENPKKLLEYLIKEFPSLKQVFYQL